MHHYYQFNSHKFLSSLCRQPEGAPRVPLEVTGVSKWLLIRVMHLAVPFLFKAKLRDYYY